MIIPSIDIMDGRSVQLRQGKEFVLDGGDPMELLRRFSVVGEVAVIDIDAALGRGSNRDLISRMLTAGRCRVGGGIRSVDSALEWLDRGAEKVILGTAAVPEILSRLPRERVIAAVDSRNGKLVTRGWETRSEELVEDRIRATCDYVSGFLATFVEVEGELTGLDMERAERLKEVCSTARLTVAGGTESTNEISRLHRTGIDVQVGMALYQGLFTLGEAAAACLIDGAALVPTVVVDEMNAALGLVWSNAASVTTAIDSCTGVYWSRSRKELWKKGATSGNTQELIAVDSDCDGDALRFTVRQANGFCHRGSRSCFGTDFTLGTLEDALRERASNPASGSGTNKLLADNALLVDKILEEANELTVASTAAEVTHEAADLIYMVMVKLVGSGVRFEEVINTLRFRNQRVTRRAMETKNV